MAKQKDSSDLPKREDKAQRQADQERAARIERESFSVPDRFADRRAPGTGSYGHERD